MSLVGALEEYLKDPNFEQNRIEYRASRLAADQSNGEARSSTSVNEGASAKSAQKVSFAETNKPEKGTDIPPPFSKRLRVKFGLAPKPTFPPPAAAKPEANQTMQDFFSAIEEEQPTMFNPQTGR